MANTSEYEVYADQWQPSAGDSIAAATFTSMEDGIQSEFVDRTAISPFNGVVSGMAPTEDETNDEIDIASGTGYAEGYRLEGSTSVTLVGEAAGTYYIYVDPTETNETDAYKAKTTFPTQAELLLAKVTWDGTDTLTSFLDLRQWGTHAGEVELSDPSTSDLSTGTKFRKHFKYPVCVRNTSLIIDTCGTAGTTIVDIHTGTAGSTATIWSAAANRFQVGHADTDGAVVAGNVADQNYKLDAEDVLEIIVDTIASSASGIHCSVVYTYY